MNKLFTFIMLWMMSCLPTLAQAPMDGGVWEDNTGKHINAHGGNIFNYKGTYYWYGESPSQDGKPYSSLGVSCFTSKDLKKWTNHGLVLPVSNEAGSDIEGGCIIERPKVLYNKKTRKFVMLWLLLRELNSMQQSLAPGTCMMLIGCSLRMSEYGLSFTTTMLCFWANATSFS